MNFGIKKGQIVLSNRLYNVEEVELTRCSDREVINLVCTRALGDNHIPYGSFYKSKLIPDIKDAVFNGPATIVFWSDGTKTIVKCDDSEEFFDPEKGLAMAIAKKALGNKGNYFNVIKKWTDDYSDDE